MFKNAGSAGTSGYQNGWSTQGDTPHSSNQASSLNGQIDNSSVPESKPRKIVRILLVPVKVVAICVTVPVCAALECLSGISIGIILGSALIMKAYDNHGLPLAMPIAIVVFPLSLVMGAGCALVGFFFGIYDGFHLGWNGDKEPLKQTAFNVKGRIDRFLSNSHTPVVTHSARTEHIENRSNIQVDDNFPVDSVETDADIKGQTVTSATDTTTTVSTKKPLEPQPTASPLTMTSNSDSATNELKQPTVPGSNPFGDENDF